MTDTETTNEADNHEKNGSPFYQDAAKYWMLIPPTVDGMLGGLGHLTHKDINASEKFLKSLFQMTNPPGKGRAIDCGAGIGRITKHFLQFHFDTVDLVDQDQNFIREAKRNLAGSKKVGSFYCCGLQDFCPTENTYDVIWVQWVLSHLVDPDLMQFFTRCRKALKPNGVIVVKENLTSSGQIEMDDSDSSVTRPESILVSLICQAGLRLIRDKKQQKFPRELYLVKIFAFRPKTNIESEVATVATEKCSTDIISNTESTD